MKIIVTGVTGFIGTNFTNAFKDKYEVIGLGRKKHDLSHFPFDYIATDYSYESLINVFCNIDAILHLAASRGFDKENFYHDNVEIDRNVFSAAHHCNVKNVVFSSSRSVYGGQQVTPWKENHTLKPLNQYAKAKIESENIAEAFIRRGLCIKIIRLAQVFGVGEYSSTVITNFIENCRKNKKLHVTVTGIMREYIYVKDVISAFDVALQDFSHTGIYNLGSGEVISLQEMAEKLSDAFGLEDNVELTEEKRIDEYSLMDSASFFSDFQWRPKYDFDAACRDVENIIPKGCHE